MTNPGKVGASVTPPWVMLHGLFGDRDNLRSLALHLERARPVLRLNLAGHGGEPAPPRMTLDSLADRVAEALNAAGVPHCHLLGHSLGGKVAMTLAGRQHSGGDEPTGPRLASVTVLDIAPKHYDPHHRPLLDALHRLDLDQIKSRSEADAALRDQIPEAGTRAFLLKSLARIDDQWRWQFALDRLVEDYDALAVAPPWVEPAPDSGMPPALFVRGTDSNYLTEDDIPLVRRYFPNARLRAVKASHWLHAEKPAQVAELCEAFVNDLES